MNSEAHLQRPGALRAPAGRTPFRPAQAAIGRVLANRLVLQTALVFLGYLVAGEIGQATTNIRSGNLGPVWPASGIALAGVLAYGTRVWPGIFAATFLVALGSPVHAVTAVGQAVGATLAAVAGGYLTRRSGPFNPTFPRLNSIVAFIVFGSFASSTIAATLGTLSLYATGHVPYSGLMSAWLIYWLGDATGVLLITPLALACPTLSGLTPRRIATELLPLLLLLVGTCVLVFGDLPLLPVRPQGLALGVLPLVIWAALSFGIGGAALSVFIVAAMATVFTALGSGPFAVNTPFINAVLLDVLFVVLSVTGLIFASVIGERERAENERAQLIREQASMESRLRLAAVVDSSYDAVMTLTLGGLIETWNASAQRILGWSAAEVLGRPVSVLMSTGREEETKALFQRLIAGHRIDPLRTTRVTKTGRVIDVVITLSPIRNAEGELLGAAEILRDVTQERRTAEALSRLSGRLITAQEQERNRIARELHDDIAQRLALLATNLTGLADESKAASAVQTHAVELQRDASEIAGDVQQLSHRLHSSRLDLLGLSTAMKHFCREFGQQHKSWVEFAAREVPEQLSPAVSLCLYRIMQEALHNSAKHSGSRQCDVELRRVYDDLELVVTDSGAGFDVEAARNSRGIGLISMEERVKLVGGGLLIESRPGHGTTIRARVPISSSVAS